MTDSVSTTNDFGCAASPINWDYLHVLSDGCIEFEMELLQLFVIDSSERLIVLRDAIATENFAQIEQAAHHLKGAGANIGATLIQVAADQLEQQARHQHLQSPHYWLAELETCLAHIKATVIA